MNYRTINTDRQFKDATGHSKKAFLILLKDYEKTYLKANGQSYESHIAEYETDPPKLKTLGDALFLVLFQMKNDLVWGSLGCIFGMAGSTAHSNFSTFSDLLEMTLKKKSNA